MPSWEHNDDRALEAALRAARPQPRAEVTQAIADRVRPRRSATRRRFGKMQLALAGGITALALTPVAAMGFGFDGLRNALNPGIVLNLVIPNDDDDAVVNQYTEAECDALVDLASDLAGIPINLEVLQQPGLRALLQLNLGGAGLGELDLCIGVDGP